MNWNLMQKMALSEGGKIVYLILDGIGGVAAERCGQTVLQASETPHLDQLASRGVAGLHEPVGPGICAGSGPGLLGLFGYNPDQYKIGRGVFSALGSGFPLRPSDIAARGNFCTVDKHGRITDRRAGHIATTECRRLCSLLDGIHFNGITFHVEPLLNHRFLLVVRGRKLNAAISDTDPFQTGRMPYKANALEPEAEFSATMLNRFIEIAADRLAAEPVANNILLRGFDSIPSIESLPAATHMRCKAFASFPTYKGLARLIGMEAIDTRPMPKAIFQALEENWTSADFFFIHAKNTTPASGEEAFDEKCAFIEQVDKCIPALMNLLPDVVVVTGDHSTLNGVNHQSWHPVPILLHAPKSLRPDPVRFFNETSVLSGDLGLRLPAKEILPLAMKNAGRIRKSAVS